jgi:tetratricopeptide (TPR) repeat protein
MKNMTQTPRWSDRSASLMRIAPLRVALCALLLAGCTTGGPQGNGDLAGRQDPATVAGVSTAAVINIAEQLRAKGDLPAAISFYRRAIVIDPNQVKPYIGLGETLLAAGHANEAAETFRAALAMAPNNAEATRGLGLTLVALDKPTEAIEMLNRSLKTAPSARAYSALGVAENLLGNSAEATEAFRKGLTMAPDDLDLLNNYGLSQALAGNYDDAIKTLHRVATDPRATSRNRLNLAMALGLAGRAEDAAQVARIDLDEQSVKSNLAYYAELRGLSPEARASAILRPGMPLVSHTAKAEICDSPPCGSPVIPGDKANAAPAIPVESKPLSKADAAKPAAAETKAVADEKPMAAPKPVKHADEKPMAAPKPVKHAKKLADATPEPAATDDKVADAKPVAPAEPEPAATEKPVPLLTPDVAAQTKAEATSAPMQDHDAAPMAADEAKPASADQAPAATMADSAPPAAPATDSKTAMNATPATGAKDMPATMPAKADPAPADQAPTMQPADAAAPEPAPQQIAKLDESEPAAAAHDPAPAPSTAGAAPAGDSTTLPVANQDTKTDPAPQAAPQSQDAAAGSSDFVAATGEPGPVLADASAAPAADGSANTADKGTTVVAAAPAHAATSKHAPWVQLATFRSEQNAQDQLQSTLNGNEDLLHDLPLIIRKVDLGPEKGVYYLLRIGPLENTARAHELCSALKDRKLDCIVAR